MQIERDDKASLSAIAESLHWRREDGVVHKDRARRATDKLKRDKLVTYEGRKWKITPAGFDALTDIRAERHREAQAAKSAARMAEKSAVRRHAFGPHEADED